MIGRRGSDKSCAGSIAAHPFDKLRAGPCKKRKDGAPSVGMVQSKGGPPASLVSKQAAVAGVVFVDVQTTLLDNLGSSSQCCRDGRIANVWQRLDENFLDFFQCEAVIEPGPHMDGEFMGLTHGNHDGHRN